MSMKSILVPMEHHESMKSVLETALELGAPNIRVWAGARGSSLKGVVDR